MDEWSSVLQSGKVNAVRHPKQTCSAIAVMAALFKLMGKVRTNNVLAYNASWQLSFNVLFGFSLKPENSGKKSRKNLFCEPLRVEYNVCHMVSKPICHRLAATQGSGILPAHVWSSSTTCRLPQLRHCPVSFSQHFP